MNQTLNPLADQYSPNPSDEALVRLAIDGDAAALESLLQRHQRWLYNVTLRMLYNREDAEDATQEVMLKLATRLASFRGESSFRTWVYRIAANHVLDRKRSAAERAVHDFGCYASYLDNAPDQDLRDTAGSTAETRLLVEETKLGCMMGLLLCLDRSQRMLFVLGEIFGTSDALGGEVLGISPVNFRQKLARARDQIRSFLRGRCGLIDPSNPCRCERKTLAFIKDGVVDPDRLQFATPHLRRVRQHAGTRFETLASVVDAGNALLYRSQPFFEAPDLVARVRSIIEGRDFRDVLDLKPS